MNGIDLRKLLGASTAFVVLAVAACDRQPLGMAPRHVESEVVEHGDTTAQASRTQILAKHVRAAGGGYECENVEDCFRQCPEPQQVGGSTVCSCQAQGGGGFWCSVTHYGPGEHPEGDEACRSGGGGGGGVRPTGLGPTFTKCHAKLTLDCPTTGVTRGDEVTCTASFPDPKGTVYFKWEFTPEGRGAKIWDHGSEREDLPRVTESTTSGRWSGTAVHGGTVVVTAHDTTGLSVAATADLSVTSRKSWGITATFNEGHPLTGYLGWGIAVLGSNEDAPRNGSSAGKDILKGVGKASVRTVVSGPNRGYAYVESHGYTVARFRRINERLTSSGPAEVPDSVQGDVVNHWTYLTRRGHDPNKALEGTTAHEGYGQNGAKGHQGQIEAALTTSACGDAAGLVERIVSPSEAGAHDLIDDVEDAALKALTLATSHYYVHNNHSGSPIVIYTPGISLLPHIRHHTDSLGAKPGYPSLAGCEWSF